MATVRFEWFFLVRSLYAFIYHHVCMTFDNLGDFWLEESNPRSTTPVFLMGER